MSTRGTHRSGREKDLKGLVLIGTLVAIVPLTVAAVAELLAYSPYENPRAEAHGAWLLVLPVIVVALVAFLLGRFIIRAYLIWRRSLTPEQRAALVWIELASLAGAHLFFRHRRKETNARLTASVMGEVPPPVYRES